MNRLDYQEPPVSPPCWQRSTRRRGAPRRPGHPTEHQTSFAATTGAVLVGEAGVKVWQQCGAGFEMATILSPNLNLLAIPGWLGGALIVLQDLIRSRARLFS